jgi:hypothetical protein
VTTRTGTVIIWVVTTLSPLTLAATLLMAPGLWPLANEKLIDALGVLGVVGTIVLAIIDQRTLKRSGVDRPFHWAWSFFTIVNLSLVYVAGRAVIAKRNGLGGLGPIWVGAALLLTTMVLGIASLLLIAAVQFVNQPPE